MFKGLRKKATQVLLNEKGASQIVVYGGLIILALAILVVGSVVLSNAVEDGLDTLSAKIISSFNTIG